MTKTARTMLLALSLVAFVATAVGCGPSSSSVSASSSASSSSSGTAEEAADYAWPEGPHPTAVLRIAGLGEIVIELYPELAPETVANFEKLARAGFYDGTTFHRVIPDFMIQGGDPWTRDDKPANDGQGGPAYTIDDEFNGAPHLPGVVSMANTGRPNSGGSQFFILTGEAPQLDGKHTIFGRLRSGSEVIEAINAVETDTFGRWGPKARPIENVVVEAVTIRAPGELASAD